MDSFSFNLQAEKNNAILKHRKLQRITSLVRIVEVCVVLILISKLSLKVPVVVKNSSEYLRNLSLFVNSPRFVFLIGNVIIITLFAQGSIKKIPEPDFYHQLVHKNLNNTKREEKDGIRKDNGDTESDKCSENDGICGSTVEENKRIDAGETMKKGGANNNICLEVKKSYRRCETEILNKRRRVLRRCKSEIKRKSIEGGHGEEVGRISYPEDEMSSEEFRRTVEDFIARQQRIYRGED